MNPRFILRAAATLIVLATLSACAAAIEEEVGECEPGVDSLSQTMSSIPMTPC